MLIIAAKNAFLKNRTGVEEYTFQLIKHLRKIVKKDKVLIFTNKIEVNLNLPSNFHFKIISLPLLWTQIGLSFKILKLQIKKKDLKLFIPAHVVPLVHPKKTIVTIHGLEYEYFPKSYSWLSRSYLKWSTRYATKKAWKIIVPSKSTKNDLIKLYSCNPDKIKVIYHGVDKPDNVTEKLDPNYFLYLGRIEKKKNVLGIVKAFQLFRKNNPDKKHQLYLVGGKGYGFQGIKRQILKSDFSKSICFKGHVRGKDKWQLIKDAQALVFPSFYEGFGLPILEAQAVETPVITSNNSSTKEITTAFCKNSALLVNPQRASEIAKAMKKIVSSDNLARKLAKNGKENVKHFSWRTTAKKTFKIIQSN